MMLFVSSLDRVPERIRSDGDEYDLLYLFGRPGVVSPGPQSFFVRSQSQAAEVAAHYHVVDQFQVFTTGDGRVGTATVEPTFIHYADAYTPYGPIVAGPKGFRYLTVRVSSDPGPNYLTDSEARARRRGRGGRHIEATIPMIVAPDPSTPLVTPAVGPFGDGLAAHQVVLAPGQRWEGFPVRGAGDHHMVLAGTIVEGGQDHPMPSSRYVAPHEATPPVVAGRHGAVVLVLSFPLPRHDSATGRDRKAAVEASG